MDDDEVDALLMKQILDPEGRVLTVTSPSKALDLIFKERIDVALLDLVMPELDGITLSARMLAACPELTIVVVTGHGTVRGAVEAMRAGAHDFVEKPVDAAALKGTVRAAIEMRRTAFALRKTRDTDSASTGGAFFGSSVAMARLADVIGRVAPSSAAVHLRGETGAGKEVIARELHDRSGRSGSFVALNAAAVPVNLLESELFGHARGAFTDARSVREGLFSVARGGTLFLDEIGDLPLTIQPKLLRALQERVVRPIGSNDEIPFDARIVTATHHDLETEVAAGRFREDLYYRIHVIRVDVPPLRERGTDVIDLAVHFLEQIATRTGKPAPTLSRAAAELLVGYSWPGNVRELENCIESAVVLARGPEIIPANLPQHMRETRRPRLIAEPEGDGAAVAPMANVERRHILRVLSLVGGNKASAAKKLGMDRRTLYRKMARHGIGLEVGRRPE